MRPLVKWHLGGDCNSQSLPALEMSVRSVQKLYGSDMDYVVCYNGEKPKALNSGFLSEITQFYQTPAMLTRFGCPAPTGPIWKIAPPSLRPGAHELTLDNDLILLKRNAQIEAYLTSQTISIMAESNNFSNVYGRFHAFMSKTPVPVNSGLVAIAPSLDMERLLASYLALAASTNFAGEPLTPDDWDHHDVQGLLGMLLHENSDLRILRQSDVPIFHPKTEPSVDLNYDGVHFVGLNRAPHRSWAAWRLWLTNAVA